MKRALLADRQSLYLSYDSIQPGKTSPFAAIVSSKSIVLISLLRLSQILPYRKETIFNEIFNKYPLLLKWITDSSLHTKESFLRIVTEQI